jgi:hypothetical protein
MAAEPFAQVKSFSSDLSWEIAMKTLWIAPLLAGAMLAAAAMTAPAQDNPNSGAGPQSMGSTGGNPGQSATQDQSANPEAAQNQPLMATGQDLNGPPQRFPAGQTPE